MKFTALVAACLSLVVPTVLATSASSKTILPSTFKPPQVFKNANVVHIVSLEKNYVKENINVLIENVSSEPQDEYFLPFTSDQMKQVGGFEVKDRKDAELTGFTVGPVEFDPSSDTQFYRIKLPAPIAPKAQQTLGISFYFLDALKPLPAQIEQSERQHLLYSFSAYCPSAYPTLKQKTDVKFATTYIPDYTVIPATGDSKEFPVKSGNKFTYGPFPEVPAGAVSPIAIRFEFNKPVTFVNHLERDVEVSHWGGNIAFEERYDLYHHGASLSSQFNRVQWASSQYFNPESFALKELKVSLPSGAKDAYFTDVIGNVSTSRFRNGNRESVLELKPRYPIFGGWKYPFTIGWNVNTNKYLKKSSSGYILNVPFVEGPKQSEGIQYENVDIRIVLPEGADNVKFYSTAPENSIVDHSVDLVRTYLDTIGRTVLTIKARNVVDELRDRELIVSYDYTTMAALRKPLVIFSSLMTAFVGLWMISKVDVKFSTK
ncbi:oligosaccharyltransferase alpha subunit [Xylariaceae sp. FL0255]|nr:oligosaccharyltransferase alpha subunit [Xylariaceae sp. FL0255]